MPDPLFYLKAMAVAAIASALFVAAIATARRPVSAAWFNSVFVLGMSLGIAVGEYALNVRLEWPPAGGLDRFFAIALPAAVVVELIAGIRCMPHSIAWLLRTCLAAMIPRILLHGSVYLSGTSDHWTLWQSIGAMALCGALLAGEWGLLCLLSQRRAGISVLIAVGLSTQCAGLTVMMAGYIKGGAAALPLAATIFATAIVVKLLAKRSGAPTNAGLAPAVGIATVGLFGLLFIGRFFGRLSTENALAMLVAPLFCWVTEMPFLRRQNPWMLGTLRLLLVSIPLVAVLIRAKSDFDREMLPLVKHVPARALQHQYDEKSQVEISKLGK